MTDLRSVAMDSTPVDAQIAARIEGAEARAWADLYAAAPPEFAARAGVATREVAGARVLRWAASGRRYFNRAVGLGVVQPATPEALDEIIRWYAEAGISMFLLQSLPHCQPADYERWLLDAGLEPFDEQDRVYRGGEPLTAPAALPPEREFAINRVGREDADDWVHFLERVYRLDTGPWLHELYDRPGWHQYIVREGGQIVGARGMFIGQDGIAWLGMDGPVPGVQGDDYGPDAALCSAMVAEGLRRGASMFITDIEAPSDAMDTPAYAYFGELGFRRPYVRTHYARI
jgi:hypothetical protein